MNKYENMKNMKNMKNDEMIVYDQKYLQSTLRRPHKVNSQLQDHCRCRKAKLHTSLRTHSTSTLSFRATPKRPGKCINTKHQAVCIFSPGN